VIDGGATLQHRLERFRSATRRLPRDPVLLEPTDLATRLADAVGGEVVRLPDGVYVRRVSAPRALPIDRVGLATLPGQPPPDVPLVCLDTETTGLATAAGTSAFLIGLGWWEADGFHQVQLMLPDHGEERALLGALEACIPPDAWLVTYNGRTFDWPLLVTRYRMARRAPPVHGGHLDLLPIVRRLFRHRLPDARLRSAEAGLLGLHRVGDLEGWEIPGRYHAFLRGGPVEPLVDVVRHNDQDVRSLAWLLAHLEGRYADPDRRSAAPPGDLAGLARAFARERRLGEALACLEAAVDRPVESAPIPAPGSPAKPARASPRSQAPGDEPWWSPRRPPDFGGPPRRLATIPGSPRQAAFDAPWTEQRIAVDRAHLLRRLGRVVEAVEAWDALAAGPGRTAILAAIEAAKLREHRLRDPITAMATVERGLSLVDRRRGLGRPEPMLEADLRRRQVRLGHRLARAAASRVPGTRPDHSRATDYTATDRHATLTARAGRTTGGGP
jgi:hypothetical protein